MHIRYNSCIEVINVSICKLENYNRKMLDLPIDSIIPNISQPRTRFDDEAMEELCRSIGTLGIIQPLTVRYKGDGTYELIAGERRLRAAKMNAMRHVPCIISDVDDASSALMALVENLQRKDLDFFEEAEGMSNLIKMTGITQQRAADLTGKTQSSVANKLRLLRLPAAVKSEIRNSSLTERHARALLSLSDEKQMISAIKIAEKNSFNVARFEQYVEKLRSEPKRKPVNKGFCRDLRIYKNTFAHTIRIMRNSGIDADIREDMFENYIQYTITIKKQDTEAHA